MGWYVAVIKKFTVFGGRASRREYWRFVLVDIIIGVVLGLVSRAASDPDIILVLYFLALFVFSLAVAVRRFHDIGISGWWLLLGLIPFAGGFILIALLTLPGNTAENRFGPVPAPAAV